MTNTDRGRRRCDDASLARPCECTNLRLCFRWIALQYVWHLNFLSEFTPLLISSPACGKNKNCLESTESNFLVCTNKQTTHHKAYQYFTGRDFLPCTSAYHSSQPQLSSSRAQKPKGIFVYLCNLGYLWC